VRKTDATLAAKLNDLRSDMPPFWRSPHHLRGRRRERPTNPLDLLCTRATDGPDEGFSGRGRSHATTV